LGKPFDPQLHQALMVEKTEEYEENTVIEELQKGYMLQNRVIRPSLVKVSG
jgi:molecular chaperone GrpE